MKRVELLVFSTFAIVNHSEEILQKIVAIKKSIQPELEFVVTFENRLVYDFDYFGYNIRNDYGKLIERIKEQGIETHEINNRTLYTYAIQSARSNLVYLLGINVQQLRTLCTDLTNYYKSNIVDVIVLNYLTDTLQSINIDASFEDGNKEFITCNNDTIESIDNILNIDLRDFEKMDHGGSCLYFPKNNHRYMYKVLKGNFPKNWIAKISCMQQISRFCSKHRIPNSIPLVYHSSDLLLLKMAFIDGISVAGMVSYRGLKENLDISEKERIPVVSYIKQLCQAINFYHFLGLYISDIKEDNFFYTSRGIIPIDTDGFSLFTYPSSQPRIEYRDKRIIPDLSPYYHSSAVETYSFSFLLFKILFNKKQPIYFDDEEKSIDTWILFDAEWYKRNKENRSERFNKETINSWNALPDYIQSVFSDMFCNGCNSIECFDSSEWLPIVYLYLQDLQTARAVLDYRNLNNEKFQRCSQYDFETIIDNEIEDSYQLLLKARLVLLIANGFLSLAVLGTIIYTFLI